MNDRIYKNGTAKLRSVERLKRLEVDKVLSLCLEERNIKTLLDIGTGSGLFAEAFSKLGVYVTGIDINKEMIEAAKLYIPEGQFLISPAEEIPFTEELFDAAFFGLVFHEVSDYKKALSESFRVSKHYTFILEWQYKRENFGPPIEHRLKPEFIENTAVSIGYKNLYVFFLSSLVLYILEK